MANETTQRPTPGVVGVLNYLIDELNIEVQPAGNIPNVSHGDSVLQCLNILYEFWLFSKWLQSDEGSAADGESYDAAAEQLGIDPAGEITAEQENLLTPLYHKLLLQRAPRFDLFSTTEEAVEYWMRRALGFTEESGESGGSDPGSVHFNPNTPGTGGSQDDIPGHLVN